MGEMVKMCFRKPKEGEGQTSGNKNLLKVIRNEFPSGKTNLSTKAHFGTSYDRVGL